MQKYFWQFAQSLRELPSGKLEARMKTTTCREGHSVGDFTRESIAKDKHKCFKLQLLL